MGIKNKEWHLLLTNDILNDMFERLFGALKNPEKGKIRIQRIVERELYNGITGPMLSLLFRKVQKENRVKNLGLTNNAMLNIIENVAIELNSEIQDIVQGGLEEIPEHTTTSINSDIDKIRQELTYEERKS